MYPDSIDKFTEKLNKIDNNTYVIEEEVTLKDGVYQGNLDHDNVSATSINVYSGKKLTGEKIDNFILSTPSKTPWKKNIKIFSNYPVVYITYETQGDTIEAEDINIIQESIVNTQKEIDRYKDANDTEVNKLKEKTKEINDSQVKRTEMGAAGGVATLDSKGVNVQTPKAHTHDDRYYTKTEANNKFATKDEITNTGNGDMTKAVYDTNKNGIVDKAESVEWGGILNKPTRFTPSTHKHTKAQISDFPSSLPANGGNADTLDNKHASDFMKAGPLKWNDLKGV